VHALRCAVRLGTGAGRELRFTPDGVSALKPGRTDVRARIEYQCDNARTTAEEHRFGRRTNVCRSRPDPIDSTDPRVVRCGPTVWALLRTCSDWGVCVCATVPKAFRGVAKYTAACSSLSSGGTCPAAPVDHSQA
jgi:hypothetical protein